MKKEAKYMSVITEKAKNIQKWLPEYIEENFDKILGEHLVLNHINCTNKEQINRLTIDRKNVVSSFYGSEEVIVSAIKRELLDDCSIATIAYWLATGMEESTNIDVYGLPQNTTAKSLTFKGWKNGQPLTEENDCEEYTICFKRRAGNDFYITSVYPIRPE